MTRKVSTRLMIWTICTLSISSALANKSFEINQENCNLPMQEIRALIPDRDEQKKALEQCTEKAMKERWKRRPAQGNN